MGANQQEQLFVELKRIQVIGHLLEKAGETEGEVCMSGWALEGAGKMIVESACEVVEALSEAGDRKPVEHRPDTP